MRINYSHTRLSRALVAAAVLFAIVAGHDVFSQLRVTDKAPQWALRLPDISPDTQFAGASANQVADIFSRDRAHLIDTTGSRSIAPTEQTTMPQQIVRPTFILLGTTVARDASAAIIRRNQERPRLMHVGEMLDSLRLLSIAPGHAKLSYSDSVFELYIPRQVMQR